MVNKKTRRKKAAKKESRAARVYGASHVEKVHTGPCEVDVAKDIYNFCPAMDMALKETERQVGIQRAFSMSKGRHVGPIYVCGRKRDKPMLALIYCPFCGRKLRKARRKAKADECA